MEVDEVNTRMMDLLESMLETIKTHKMINDGDHIIIGLSGGADSLAMTHGLIRLRGKFNCTLTAVHINHMFRGAAADADAEFVQNFCAQEGIACYVFNEDVQSLAHQRGISFEEMGRIVRYEKFEQVRAELSANKIAVAQNRNDVVETFFINLFRGAGVDGLSSIEYMRGNLFIRPLLNLNRIDIEAYCKCNHLEPRHDHTNLENDYVRNRIRNELLPYLRTSFNPNIDEALMKTIRIMKDEKSFWSIHEKKLFEQSCTRHHEEIHLNLECFKTITDAEKIRLIRMCVALTRGSLEDLNYEVFKRISQMDRTGATYMLDANWRVDCRYKKLIFRKVIEENMQAIPPLYQVMEEVERLGAYTLTQTCVAVDADSIVGELYVRTRVAGDRFVPMGMDGHKKIKDFLIDEKVPREKRDSILLVCDEEKIVWVENMRLHNLCRITPKTKKVLILSFQELVESP